MLGQKTSVIQIRKMRKKEGEGQENDRGKGKPKNKGRKGIQRIDGEAINTKIKREGNTK